MEKINRVEVINHSKDGEGREYVIWKDNIKVEQDLQDNGRTLKIFITDLTPQPKEECNHEYIKDRPNCIKCLKPQQECKYCYGKGYYTQLVGIYLTGDFPNDDPNKKMKEIKRPCPKCKPPKQECKHKLKNVSCAECKTPLGVIGELKGIYLDEPPKQEEWKDWEEKELRIFKGKYEPEHWIISLEGVVSIGGNKTKEDAIKALIKDLLKTKEAQIRTQMKERTGKEKEKLDLKWRKRTSEQVKTAISGWKEKLLEWLIDNQVGKMVFVKDFKEYLKKL
jgi:hypothetical protein